MTQRTMPPAISVQAQPAAPLPSISRSKTTWQRNKTAAAVNTNLGSMLLAPLMVLMSTLVISSVARASWKTTDDLAQAEKCPIVTDPVFQSGNSTDNTSSELNPRLRCLRIQGHKNLDANKLSDFTYLTHLYIDNNDELEKIKLPRLANLTYLSISNNKNLENKDDQDIDFTNLPNLKCLTINNNENLHHVSLSSLIRLTCLQIRNNKCLEELDLSNLIGLRQLRIINNARLATINLPDLGQQGQGNINHNGNLEKITVPEFTRFLNLHIKNNEKLNTIEFTNSPGGVSYHTNLPHWSADYPPGQAIRLALHGPPEHPPPKAGGSP